MTINGRVVDFPMKVGDAGEAFFVFETEQDVPEEFATSPLAGPNTDKVEEDIDYLDLAEGHSTMTYPPDDIGKSRRCIMLLRHAERGGIPSLARLLLLT